MDERVMIKLRASDDFIIIRVVIRDRYKRKEFYIHRDKFLSLKEEKSLTASDGNFAVFHADEQRNELHIRFYWLNLSNEDFTGRLQTVLIPLSDTLEFVEKSASEFGPKTMCMLSKDSRRRPRLIFQSRRRLAEVVANKQVRRKLVKVLQSHFNWPSSTEIRLYDDFVPYSFFFREFRGDQEGINGGLIFSGRNNMTTATYSVHT